MSLRNPIKYAFKHKALLHDARAPPVTNTWYTVLSVSSGHRIRQIRVEQSNVEVAAKNIEVKITLDGVVYTETIALGSGAAAYLYIDEDGLLEDAAFECQFGMRTKDSLGTDNIIGDREMHTILVEYRNTSAAGTTQTLDMYVTREALEAVIA